MRILVIGYGQTGFQIVKNLSKIKTVDEILIFDPLTNNKLIDNKTKFLKSLNTNKIIDYIIISFSSISQSKRKQIYKKYNTSYDVRQSELNSNLNTLKKYIPFLKKISKRSKIIVVTNPMDVLTNYLQIKLKSSNVYGFGMELDAQRYSKELNKTINCIGLHGKAIPILNLKTKKEYIKLEKTIDTKLMTYLKENGTPHEFAGLQFNKFFKELISNKNKKILISCKLVDISISYPFIVNKGNIIKPVNITLNNIEKELFLDEIQQLRKTIKKLI